MTKLVFSLFKFKVNLPKIPVVLISFKLLGRVMSTLDTLPSVGSTQFQIAFSPIEVTPLGIVSVEMPAFRKALLPILVIPSGIEISVIFSHILSGSKRHGAILLPRTA